MAQGIRERVRAMPVRLISENASSAGDGAQGLMGLGVLFAESNHRIANNLTLIAGLLRHRAMDIAREGRPLTAQDACLMLEETVRRIETVGELHRHLAKTGPRAVQDFQQYLQGVAQAAIGSIALPGAMTLEPTPCAAFKVPADQALPVALIVGELVTNAVKYSHPAGVRGRIGLRCQQAPDGAMLIQVMDDGVGLPEGFDPALAGGLGLRLVRALAEQIGASLAFDSSGIGLTVGLLLPASSPMGPK
jgi:two-component sensor histidine kinase